MERESSHTPKSGFGNAETNRSAPPEVGMNVIHAIRTHADSRSQALQESGYVLSIVISRRALWSAPPLTTCFRRRFFESFRELPGVFF
jgi:hypothetical protein